MLKNIFEMLQYATSMLLLLSILDLNSRRVTQAASASFVVGHYHHNKRQQPQSPSLTLNVEPSHGIEPSHHTSDIVPDYYFPVDSGLFNFTCTIKHPSQRYKLVMTKEQIFNTKLKDGEKKDPIDLIDVSDYIINPLIGDKRMEIEFSEPTYIDSTAKYLRVSLLIKNLKLEDNGVYTCKYSNINKKINTIVYKPVTNQHVTFPIKTNIDKLQLNQLINLTCRVNDVYPKPKVVFTHSKRENLAELVSEKDISNTIHNQYYPYSIMSTISFTPTYLDNNEKLNCLVTSIGSQNITVVKTLNLVVTGIQIIDSECADVVPVKVGEKDFKITCVFFANPKLISSYWETTATVEEKAKQEAGGDQEQSESAQPSDSSANSNGDSKLEIIKIVDGEEIYTNYNAVVEEYGTPNSGLYKAILKIKEVRQEDLKNFTIKLEKVEKVIKLVTSSDEIDKNLKTSESTDSTSSTLNYVHSKSNCVLLLINIIFIIFFLRR